MEGSSDIISLMVGGLDGTVNGLDGASDVISVISNYIPKSKVNLLCLNRNRNFSKNKNIKEIIRSVDVSAFIT